jgi:hypothetical protein
MAFASVRSIVVDEVRVLIEHSMAAVVCKDLVSGK